MSSIAQILDRTQHEPGKGGGRPERREFKPEWLTTYVAVVKKDSTVVEAKAGSALDEHDGDLVAEVRRSNHFPVPRYQVFVGTRTRGRNIPTVSPRTSVGQNGAVECDTKSLDLVPLAYQAASSWIKADLAQIASRPNVQKAIQSRLQRDRGGDGAPQVRSTGKTERERAKKQRPGG